MTSMHNNWITNEDTGIDLERIHENIENLNYHCKEIKGLTVLHVNIRSINKNYEKLLILLNNINFKPHIIACTETWNIDCPYYFNIDTYNLHYNDSHINKADGTLVYVHNSLKYKTEIEDCNEIKIVSILVELEQNNNIKISTVYKSHEVKNRSFLESFKFYLDKNKIHKNHNHIYQQL